MGSGEFQIACATAVSCTPLQSHGMSFAFEIEATRERARKGRLLTAHGAIETPVFMPVGTQATVKGVPQDFLEELGVEILLGNTYHLYLRPGVAQVRKLGGLHRFMSWPRAILTDSGGFQVFSLSDLRKVTEGSAERTIEIGFDGYAIGGLSVGEPRALTREIVESTIQHLPADKPRYLMGVGTPEEIVEYANLGIDMMDCVLPTRAARHGLLFTSEGKISIKQARYAGDEGPLDPNCGCRVCGRYSRAYLRHLYASNEVLAQVLNTIHNLSFYLDTMRAVRHSIRLGARGRSASADRTEQP